MRGFIGGYYGRFIDSDTLCRGNSIRLCLSWCVKCYFLGGEQMSWYDGLDELGIEMLKENTTPFGLCTKWKQKVFIDILKKDPASLQVYFGATNNWGTADLDDLYLEGVRTYRLNPDWQRPEEKKEGHWEYCNVKRESSTDVYSFSYKNLTWTLNYAQSFPGFGGFEFAEYSGQWCWSLLGWNVSGEYLIDSDAGAMGLIMPATPKRVRFWVEG